MTTELIQTLLETDRQYGELAGGPNFVLDLRLLPTPDSFQTEPSSEELYTWLQTAYVSDAIASLTLESDHLDNLCSTLERDRTSEYWNVEENDREITTEEFLPWLQECFHSEDCYECDGDRHPYADQIERLEGFAAIVQPQLFGDATALILHTLTDVNNENTPYGVYLLIGAKQTLLVITHWIL